MLARRPMRATSTEAFLEQIQAPGTSEWLHPLAPDDSTASRGGGDQGLFAGAAPTMATRIRAIAFHASPTRP
jgi:hypothetical protein